MTGAAPIEPLYTEDELEAARVLFAQPVAFMMGAVRMDGLPAPFALEVAFAGRSNVGKSSMINMLGVTRCLMALKVASVAATGTAIKTMSAPDTASKADGASTSITPICRARSVVEGDLL